MRYARPYPACLLLIVMFNLCLSVVLCQAMTGSCSAPAMCRQTVILQVGGSCSADWESETASSSAKRDKHSPLKIWCAEHHLTVILARKESNKKKLSVIFKNRPRSPMSPHGDGLCLCCVMSQYLPVAWTPEAY